MPPTPAPNEQTLVVDGAAVHVTGEGRETLLMIHGWPDTHRLWDGTVAALADRHRCARFTLPGYGPERFDRLPDLDEVTRLVLRIVDVLCPDGQVTLVLHDWGCAFGYQFYMRHPERVARIVGVDIGDVHRLQRTLPKAQLLGIAAYQLWLALAWKIGGGLGDAMTRWLGRQMRVRRDVGALRAQMNWPYALTWFGGRRSLAQQGVAFRPACPMLYLWGLRKPFMFHSPDWPAQVANLPGGKAQAFQTSHWVMLDEPVRFHAVVRDWLEHAPAA